MKTDIQFWKKEALKNRESAGELMDALQDMIKLAETLKTEVAILDDGANKSFLDAWESRIAAAQSKLQQVKSK